MGQDVIVGLGRPISEAKVDSYGIFQRRHLSWVQPSPATTKLSLGELMQVCGVDIALVILSEADVGTQRYMGCRRAACACDESGNYRPESLDHGAYGQ